ncbi:MAG TPA: DUF6152 family protein [Terriglobia bacterium]|nr:DUF6152 family protein [Terriglobia bacterium]
MKSKSLVAMLVTMVLLVVSSVMFAHHTSSGLFDSKVNKTLKGAVQKWLYVNPHAALVIEVKDAKGNAETWRVEFTSPNGLKACCSLSRTSLQAGDQVTVVGHPYFNNIKTMDAEKLTLPNGKELAVRNVAAPEYEESAPKK